MNKKTLAPILTLMSILVILSACSGQPYEDKDIDDYTDEDIFANKKPLNFTSASEQQTPQPIYAPSTSNPQILQAVPLTRKEGVLSFDEWKKAKEMNSQEYQEYLEYREYLQTLQAQ